MPSLVSGASRTCFTRVLCKAFVCSYSTRRILGAALRTRRTAARMMSASPKPDGGSLSVAVIGAGAAGLVAARELHREGHKPTVFEQGSKVGGVWVYTDDIEEPVAATDRQRLVSDVHSSMYKNLRTNLPREVMSYTDFPFTQTWLDPRRFCSHLEVEAYLEAFASAFEVLRFIQFKTKVVEVMPLAERTPNSSEVSLTNGISDSHACNGASHQVGDEVPWPRWQVTTACADDQSDASTSTATFDAVVVCNGHYSEPRRPRINGAERFSGRIMHSHSYRENEPFWGLTVIVIGASASGEDICREISLVADRMFLSARTWQNPAWAHETHPFGPQANIWRRSVPSQLHSDGSVTFEGGERAEHVDVIIYATGYCYMFPFLENAQVVSVDDNRVSRLYQHIFPPNAAPTLSFVGLPWKVVPFAQYELQAKWIARVLSRRVSLPSRAEMEAHISAFYAALEKEGIPKRHTHQLGDRQWEYNDWIAAACGPDVSALPNWRPKMYKVAGDTKRASPETYRDEWPETKLIAEAAKEAQRLGVPVEVAAA